MPKRNNKRSDLGELVLELSQHIADTVPTIKNRKRPPITEVERLGDSAWYFSVLGKFTANDCSKEQYDTDLPEFINSLNKAIEERDNKYQSKTNLYGLGITVNVLAPIAAAVGFGVWPLGFLSLSVAIPAAYARKHRRKQDRFLRYVRKLEDNTSVKPWALMFRDYSDKLNKIVKSYTG